MILPRYHECAAAVCDIMSIPSIVNGGALILLLSTVRWSPSNYGTLQELEEVTFTVVLFD